MIGRSVKVLLVEDNPGDARLLSEALRETGNSQFDLTQVERLSEGLRRLGDERFDVVLLDLTLPDARGIDTIARLHEQAPDVPAVVLTGLNDETLALEALRQGAQDYLVKGQVDGQLLVRAIRYAIERNNVEQEIQRQLRRISALREINMAATSTLDLRSVSEIVLEKIDNFFPKFASTVRLHNKISGLLEPVACRNIDEELWRTEKWRGGRGITSIVFQSKSPVTIANIQEDPRAADLDFFRTQCLLSYLGVPLTARNETLGVLSLYAQNGHRFSDDEIEFVSTIAGQAAVALHNAQLYGEMKMLAANLGKAYRTKTEFLSVISHELRTPLTAMFGYAGMMRDKILGEINTEQDQALGAILNQTNELLAMIDSILQATQLEADSVKVENREVHLLRLLDALRATYAFPSDKNATLRWDYPEGLPVLHTDGGKLKQILQNLINNAIKFTDEGHVTVSARHLPESDRVVFAVADTGVGISEKSLPIIFDMFRQVDSSETRGYGGVGLGLYIVRKFTRLLGGEIKVESEVGKGSTFTMTLPARKAE
jgi:signal transduction histidine kinase/CheY-like chemotaxis protein